MVDRPLTSERSLYMQRAAERARQALERFADGSVSYNSTALQLLDEWIERETRRGPLPRAAQVLVMAFVGQMFLNRHGGYWAIREEGGQQRLGVVCPVAGQVDQERFIDVAGQVALRLKDGIRASLAFFYLAESVDLQRQS